MNFFGLLTGDAGEMGFTIRHHLSLLLALVVDDTVLLAGIIFVELIIVRSSSSC